MVRIEVEGQERNQGELSDFYLRSGRTGAALADLEKSVIVGAAKATTWKSQL